MKIYDVKSFNKRDDYMEMLDETADGYKIRICRDLDGYYDIKEDFLSKEMFESCIRTGYLTERQPEKVE